MQVLANPFTEIQEGSGCTKEDLAAANIKIYDEKVGMAFRKRVILYKSVSVYERVYQDISTAKLSKLPVVVGASVMPAYLQPLNQHADVDTFNFSEALATIVHTMHLCLAKQRPYQPS